MEKGAEVGLATGRWWTAQATRPQMRARTHAHAQHPAAYPTAPHNHCLALVVDLGHTLLLFGLLAQ